MNTDQNPGITAFNGPMMNAKTPAAANAASAPTQTAAPQVAPMPPAAAAPPQQVGYGQTSSFGPSQNLIGTQIAPGQESNRFDLAKQQLDTYKTQTLPQFQHDLRSTIQGNAAMGRLGSGMLNTDVGNLDRATERDYNTMESGLLNNALGAQITDNANQRGELRGERDYQGGLENQAYNRGVQGLTLEDALTNSAFGRGLAQEQAGYGSSPADMQAWLSGVYGQQASNAGNAVSGLVGSTTQNNLLQGILGAGGGAGAAPTGISPGADGNFGIPSFNPSWNGGGSYTPPQLPSFLSGIQ